MTLVKAALFSLLLLAAPTADAADVTLLYNGSVRAELHDCGCKSEPLGGLARRAALVDEVAGKGEVLLVDAGNLFGDPSKDTLAQSRFVALATAEMGYEAVGVGPYELGHGIQAIQDVALESGLQFLGANIEVAGEAPFAKWTVVERGGVRCGLISVVDPSYDRAPYDDKIDGLRIADPVAVLQEELPKLREQADVVVLLASMQNSNGTVNILRALEGGPKVDLVIEGVVERQYKNPRKLGDSLVLAANARGKYLGQLDLAVDGGAITAVEGQIHKLTLDMPEQKALAAKVKDFEEEQEALAQSR